MITISQILTRKGNVVMDIADDATLSQAASMMAQRGVGALAVRSEGRLAGILSERDVVMGLATHGASAATTSVGSVMQMAEYIDVEDDIEKGLNTMTDRRRRHLLVKRSGEVIGIVSIGDLVKALNEEQVGTISSLHDYIRTS